MRHKWVDNTCSQCGLKRKKKHWKQLMAIVNHPPWEAYSHGCDMAYSKDDFETYTFKAGQCHTNRISPLVWLRGLEGTKTK